MRRRKQVYLDGAANTPLDRSVIKAMRPYMSPSFCGNSNSAHKHGAKADAAVHQARKTIAKALDVQPDEVFFTSGATESNNWAIKALALAELAKPEGERKTRIIVSAIEHASVLAACDSLKPLGFEIVHVQPMPTSGAIPVSSVKKGLRKDKTLLVCCMAVNNETGVANAVDEMAKAAHAAGALMLVDFTQAMALGDGTIKIGRQCPHADFLSFSAHKIYGPTGVGCLIKRHDVLLPPLLSGGFQEGGIRGGTHNVAGIVGMAEAVRLLSSSSEMYHFYERTAERLLELIGGLGNLNVIPDHPNIMSIDFSKSIAYPGTVADAFASKGISVSAGAACSLNGDEQLPSHVLQAMGLPEDRILCTVRVSFTKFTKDADLKAFAKAASELAKEFPAQGGDAE